MVFLLTRPKLLKLAMWLATKPKQNNPSVGLLFIPSRKKKKTTNTFILPKTSTEKETNLQIMTFYNSAWRKDKGYFEMLHSMHAVFSVAVDTVSVSASPWNCTVHSLGGHRKQVQMCPVSRIFSVNTRRLKREREMKFGVSFIICLVKRLHFVKDLIPSGL